MLPLSFAGGLVLFDEQRQRLHLLNPAAAAIWTVLDLGLTDADAAAVLASHSGRDPVACADDIAAMQEQWASDGTFGDAPTASPPRVSRERGGDGSTAWFEVGGVRLELTSEDDEVTARVAAALGDCVAAPGGAALTVAVRIDAEDRLMLFVGGTSWLISDDPGEIVGGLFHLLLHRRWGEDGWLTMIHAAALERDGAAILLPGKSGWGKTTLAAYLSRRGFALLADDFAAVRADGDVVPWPTRLSVKRGSWRTLAAMLPELDELPEREVAMRRVKLVTTGRAAWERAPVPVRALVLPRWSEGDSAAVTRLDPLEALAALVDDRVWAGWPMTEESVRALLDWLERVPAWRLRYPDLTTAEAQILEILGSLPSGPHQIATVGQASCGGTAG